MSSKTDYLKLAGNIHLSYYLEAADELGIKSEVIVRSLMAKFTYKEKHWFIINTVLPVNNVPSSTIAKRKNLTYKVLNKHKIPVAEQLEATEYKDALEFYKKHMNVVVKPVQNLGGKGVSILPRTEDEFMMAYQHAEKNDKSKTKVNVLVERFITGNNYRLLVCDNKVIGAVYRKPAAVIGDGIHSISDLISIANQQRKDNLLMPILIDTEVAKCLALKDLTMDFTPQNGQEILLRFNANLSTGGTTEECLTQIDPYYLDLAVKASKTIGLKVAGVDLIAEDITKQDNCVINEINYNPGLRVHYKVDKGDVYPVAVPIMHYIRDNYIS